MDISEFKTNTETDFQEQKTEEICRMSDMEIDPPMGFMDTFTVTPAPFDSPGPADPTQCRAANGNGIVIGKGGCE